MVGAKPTIRLAHLGMALTYWSFWIFVTIAAIVILFAIGLNLGMESNGTVALVLLGPCVIAISFIPIYARAYVELGVGEVTIQNPWRRPVILQVAEIARIESGEAFVALGLPGASILRVGVATFVTMSGVRVRALMSAGATKRQEQHNCRIVAEWSKREGVACEIQDSRQLGLIKPSA